MTDYILHVYYDAETLNLNTCLLNILQSNSNVNHSKSIQETGFYI